jgi:hypothetical protein
MKKLITLALAFSAASALACPRSQENLICTGDHVVTPDNYRGVVIGINPYKKTLSVKYDGYSTISSFGVRELALGLGCVHNVCVGDRVVTPDNYVASVIGVNPYNNNAAVHYDGYSTITSVNVAKLKTQGCLMGVCTGDSVITPDNYQGKVLGIDRWNGLVSVKYDGYSTISSFDIENISVTNYCTTYGDRDRQRPRRPWDGDSWGFSQSRGNDD